MLNKMTDVMFDESLLFTHKNRKIIRLLASLASFPLGQFLVLYVVSFLACNRNQFTHKNRKIFSYFAYLS